jgi:hypothetical protein
MSDSSATPQYATYRFHECTEANRIHQQEYRGILHNRSRYRNGCRCKKCLKAELDYAKGLRATMKARRPNCTHYKWRAQGAAKQICCICGKTRKQYIAVSGEIAATAETMGFAA